MNGLVLGKSGTRGPDGAGVGGVINLLRGVTGQRRVTESTDVGSAVIKQGRAQGRTDQSGRADSFLAAGSEAPQWTTLAQRSSVFQVRKASLSQAQSDHRVVLRFDVRDTGVDIPGALQSKLFQPFTQGDNSTTRRYGGTGIEALQALQRIPTRLFS